MAIATETSQTKTVCVNHPETETYLKCNKCGRPVCMKCVQRTPVGYRCKECLGEQRAGYYNATALDYGIAAIIAFVLGGVGGFIISLILTLMLMDNPPNTENHPSPTLKLTVN